jgi:hypothetical protein
MSGDAEEILKHLLNGDQRGGGASLSVVLAGIVPPDLCRISLTLLAANYAETRALKREFYARQDAGVQRRNRLIDGIIQAVIVAVAIAAIKALGWI